MFLSNKNKGASTVLASTVLASTVLASTVWTNGQITITKMSILVFPSHPLFLYGFLILAPFFQLFVESSDCCAIFPRNFTDF